MKAWYINLDESRDRHAHMERELSALGINYERMPAVDGRLLADDDVAKIYQKAPREHFLDRGSIGIFLSQRKVWQAIVDSGDSHGIVFEDDILFGQNAKEILSDLSWLPCDVDLLRLEIFKRYTVRDLTPLATILSRDVVQLRHVMLGAGAYIISARAASELLRQTEILRYAVDIVLFDPACNDFCGFDVYQLVPALCIQSAVAHKGGLDSTLQTMRKQSFAKGPKRLWQKVVRELDKRKLIVTGLITDKMRKRKTGKIEFR